MKTVNEDEGKKVMQAWSNGKAVIVKGSALGPHYISAIKPIKEWVDEMEKVAITKRRYFCKYGHMHPHDEECHCKNVLPELLLPGEFPSLPEPMRAIEKPDEGPPTSEEKKKIDVYTGLRDKFLKGHDSGRVYTKKALGLKPNCYNCHGTGQEKFNGTWINCAACFS